MGDIRNGNRHFETTWEVATDYLASNAGRWVPGWELTDAVFQGACSRTAIPKVIDRARRYFPIESGPLGYRIGRKDVSESICPRCFVRRVRYESEWVCYGCPSTAVVDLEVGRVAYAEGTSQGKQWTPREDDFIRDNQDSMNDDEMAAALDRTHSGVRNRRTTLQLGRKQYVRASTE